MKERAGRADGRRRQRVKDDEDGEGLIEIHSEPAGASER